MSGLYDREQEVISTAGMALLAGVDEDSIRELVPGGGCTSVATIPAPLISRMLATVHRIDPNRTLGIYAVIDHLADTSGEQR